MNYTKGEWKARHPVNNDITIYTGEYGQGIIKIAQICEGYPNAEANAYLIVATVNGCASINPDNPMAVAESIKDMYEALKKLNHGLLCSRRRIGLRLEEGMQLAHFALAKVEGK